MKFIIASLIFILGTASLAMPPVPPKGWVEIQIRDSESEPTEKCATQLWQSMRGQESKKSIQVQHFSLQCKQSAFGNECELFIFNPIVKKSKEKNKTWEALLQGAEAEAVISNLNESSLPIHFSENCGDLHIDSHTRTVKVGISSRQWGDAFLPREHLLNDRIEVSAGVSRKNKPSFKLTYVTNFGHNRPTTKYSGVQFGIYEISSESGIYYLGYQKLFVEADILSYGYEGGVISDKNTGQTGLHGAAGLGGKYFLLKQNADYILGQMMFYLSAELVFLF